MSIALPKYPRIIIPSTACKLARTNLFVKLDVNKNAKLKPIGNPIISYQNCGKILSYYNDNIWDFTPYRNVMSRDYMKLNFGDVIAEQHESVKWIVYICVYHPTSFRDVTHVSKLLPIFKCLKRLARFAAMRNVNVVEVLSDEKLIVHFIREMPDPKSLAALLSSIIKMDPRVIGFNVVPNRIITLVRREVRKLPQKKQYPVVPERLLAALLSELDELYEYINLHLDALTLFVVEVAKQDQFYAKSSSAQSGMGLRKKFHRPTFKEAAVEFGLEALFDRFGVNSLKGVSGFITRLQHGIGMYISFFTGMRSSEVAYLKSDCLNVISTKIGNRYLIRGFYIKGSHIPRETYWVTSPNVALPILIANKIGKSLLAFIDEKIDLKPLFFNGALIYKDERTHRKLTPFVKSQKVYNLLDTADFKITNADFAALQTVDPFRAWQEEPNFRIGDDWHFNQHQLRRTLAYYASQTGLVSIPTLRSQFKHLSSEMTLYYGQSKGVRSKAGTGQHFKDYMASIKPSADYIAYHNDVLNSKERLVGGSGVIANKKKCNREDRVGILLEGRDEMTKRFERGELAYHQTPLGGCTTVTPCNGRALRDITACLHCVKAIIKPSKLKRVIKRQERMVARCEENEFDNFAIRAEAEILNSLRSFEDKIRIKRRK